MTTYRIRTNLIGQSVVQELVNGKWRNPNGGLPLGPVAVMPYIEAHDMRARFAQVERRAEAQRNRRVRVLPADQTVATEGETQ